MNSKVCIACDEVKSLDSFYVHSKMKDGHLGKCKDCCKSHASARREIKLEEIQAYDRRRGRTEKHREACRARAHKYKDKRVEYNNRHKAKNPEAYKARTAVGTAIRDGKLTTQPCELCGDKAHAHHEDYSKPLEVRWLCARHHGLVHRKAA